MRKKRQNHSAGFKAKVAKLYETIGQLKIENDWLKKKLL